MGIHNPIFYNQSCCPSVSFLLQVVANAHNFPIRFINLIDIRENENDFNHYEYIFIENVNKNNE